MIIKAFVSTIVFSLTGSHNYPKKKRVIHNADRSLQVFTGQRAEFHKTLIQKGQQGKQSNSEPHKSQVLAIMLLVLGARD